MKDSYFEVRIPYNKENCGEIETMLVMYGGLSWLDEEGKFIVCLESKDEANELKKYIENSEETFVKGVEVKKLVNKDWNSEWEKSIKPVEIGKKMIVYPSWLKEELGDTTGKIRIEIDPKTAFGTGHNETTQIVLELMANYLKGDEEKLLDYGCGTAILAIAGTKLGIARAVAIDNDPEAIPVAEECIKKNAESDKIELHCANIDEIEEEEFDVICANIISSVILENIEHISAKAAKGAKLFISGVLMSEDQDIMDHLFSYDFDIEDIMSKGEWMGIYAVRR